MRHLFQRALPPASILILGLLIGACTPFRGAMHNQPGWHGGGWPFIFFGPFVMLLWVAALIAIIVIAIQLATRNRNVATPPQATTSSSGPNIMEAKMSYYFSKTLNMSFDDATEKVRAALQREGFGVLTEIDVKATLKKKIDVDFRPYLILGACNPTMAHKALTAEDKIGVMLPCNVIIQETSDGKIEVAAVDPVASMSAVGNPDLGDIAEGVRAQLKHVIVTL